MLVSPLLPGMLFMTSRRARRSPLRCFRAGRLPMLKRSAVSTRFSQSRRMWVFTWSFSSCSDTCRGRRYNRLKHGYDYVKTTEARDTYLAGKSIFLDKRYLTGNQKRSDNLSCRICSTFFLLLGRIRDVVTWVRIPLSKCYQDFKAIFW